MVMVDGRWSMVAKWSITNGPSQNDPFFFFAPLWSCLKKIEMQEQPCSGIFYWLFSHFKWSLKMVHHKMDGRWSRRSMVHGRWSIMVAQNGPSQNGPMVDGRGSWSPKWSITKWSMVHGPLKWSIQNGPSQNDLLFFAHIDCLKKVIRNMHVQHIYFPIQNGPLKWSITKAIHGRWSMVHGP
jgi:hypothetical protein